MMMVAGCVEWSETKEHRSRRGHTDLCVSLSPSLSFSFSLILLGFMLSFEAHNIFSIYISLSVKRENVFVCYAGRWLYQTVWREASEEWTFTIIRFKPCTATLLFTSAHIEFMCPMLGAWIKYGRRSTYTAIHNIYVYLGHMLVDGGCPAHTATTLAWPDEMNNKRVVMWFFFILGTTKWPRAFPSSHGLPMAAQDRCMSRLLLMVAERTLHFAQVVDQNTTTTIIQNKPNVIFCLSWGLKVRALQCIFFILRRMTIIYGAVQAGPCAT